VNPDVAADLKDLSATLGNVEAVMDLEGLRTAIGELESQATKPDLWDDPENAQKITSQLSHKQGELRRIEELRSRLDDLPVLFELAEDEGDDSSLAEADAERVRLRTDIASIEVRTLLSGEYDERDALLTALVPHHPVLATPGFLRFHELAHAAIEVKKRRGEKVQTLKAARKGRDDGRKRKLNLQG